MIGSDESHEPCSGAKVLLNTIAHSFVQFREVGRHAEAALCASSGESSFMLSQGRVLGFGGSSGRPAEPAEDPHWRETTPSSCLLASLS